MSEQTDKTITPRARAFLAERYSCDNIYVMPVEGGYSRNRRAIIGIDNFSVFAKEVDISLLPDNGEVELSWLKKDHDIINELVHLGVRIAPEWAELHLDGHLMLIPSYKKEDGWLWSAPNDTTIGLKYVQAVIDATKELEEIRLLDSPIGRLKLKPFFRDEIAKYNGILPILEDRDLRTQLIDRYSKLQQKGDHLEPAFIQMLETLNNDDSLRDLAGRTNSLAQLPNDKLSHCDVRSDNIAYNTATDEVKFVDWNWASYTPAKFGSTEFLIDMARLGKDVSSWYNDMSIELVAGTVGYYMTRSLREPLAPGSTLREMQAETAAVANYLYSQMK